MLLTRAHGWPQLSGQHLEHCETEALLTPMIVLCPPLLHWGRSRPNKQVCGQVSDVQLMTAKSLAFLATVDRPDPVDCPHSIWN